MIVTVAETVSKLENVDVCEIVRVVSEVEIVIDVVDVELCSVDVSEVVTVEVTAVIVVSERGGGEGFMHGSITVSGQTSVSVMRVTDVPIKDSL